VAIAPTGSQVAKKLGAIIEQNMKLKTVFFDNNAEMNMYMK